MRFQFTLPAAIGIVLAGLALAGCSDGASRFAHMSKGQQLQSLQYQIDHPTPLQAAMVAKMKAGMTVSAHNSAKPGPPSVLTPSASQQRPFTNH